MRKNLTINATQPVKCLDCEYHKSRASKEKGKKIPMGTGKCVRPFGICDNYIPAGNIGEEGERPAIRKVK